MPDLEEQLRDALRAHPRLGTRSSEDVWADTQRRIRRRVVRRRAVAVAAAVVLLGGVTAAVVVATVGGGGERSQVVDVGPGPSTSEPTSSEGAGPEWTRLDPGPITNREGYSATWTGRELIVWGGRGSGQWYADGAAYDPTTGAWRSLAAAPITPRSDHIAAWTGKELLVVGGAISESPAGTKYTDDDAAYDPAANSWRSIPPAPLPTDLHAGVWTGRELVVVGGGEATVDGAAYDASTNTWRTIPSPPVAIVGYHVLWTGREVLVVGGVHTDSAHVQQFHVLAYDPTTDTWRDFGGQELAGDDVGAAWTGSALVVWGGTATWQRDANGNWTQHPPFPTSCNPRPESSSVATDRGLLASWCGAVALLDPSSSTWTPTAPPSSASPDASPPPPTPLGPVAGDADHVFVGAGTPTFWRLHLPS
jgi:N-acetylneuraminic acid mutarotase